MICNLNTQQALYRILDLLYPGIAKLEYFPGIDTDKMIVLPGAEAFFKLCAVVPELVLYHQVAIQQQLDGVVQRSPAYPVFVVLHPDVQALNIKMPRGRIDLFQDSIALRCLAVAVLLQVFCKNLLYSIKCIALVLILHQCLNLWR